MAMLSFPREGIFTNYLSAIEAQVENQGPEQEREREQEREQEQEQEQEQAQAIARFWPSVSCNTIDWPTPPRY